MNKDFCGQEPPQFVEARDSNIDKVEENQFLAGVCHNCLWLEAAICSISPYRGYVVTVFLLWFWKYVAWVDMDRVNVLSDLDLHIVSGIYSPVRTHNDCVQIENN